MKFEPRTDQEIERLQEESLITPGLYDFVVREARDTHSQKGNEMTALVLTILDSEGIERKVLDYLVAVDSLAYKTKHFAQAVGLENAYQTGDMPAELMEGRIGRCKLAIQQAKNGYRAKNVVSDYIATAAAQHAEIAAQAPLDLSDSIPF